MNHIPRITMNISTYCILLLSLLFFAIVACEKEDDENTLEPPKTFGGNSSLLISFQNQPQCSPELGDTITIYTDPATDSTTFIIDEIPFTHLIEGIPISFYGIFAVNSQNYSDGFSAVLKDSLYTVELCLQPPNYQPLIEFLSPTPGIGNQSIIGDDIPIKFKVTDDRSSPDSIRVNVQLVNLDSHFSDPPEFETMVVLPSDGIVSLTLAPEEFVSYNLKVTASDEWDNTAVGNRRINNDGIERIQLTASAIGSRPSDEGVRLEWSRYRGPGFDEYTIWRSSDSGCGDNSNQNGIEWEEIASTRNQRQDSYLDQGIIPISEELCYCIQKGHPDAESNIVSLDNDRLGLFTSPITSLIGHPEERVAYGVYETDLVRIDIEELTIVARAQTPMYQFTTPSLEKQPDGSYLLYSHIPGVGIGTYDPYTLQQVGFIDVTDGDGTIAVFPESNSVILFRYEEDPDIPNTYGYFHSIDLTDGRTIDSRTEYSDVASVSRVPGKMAAISASFYDLTYFEINNQGEFIKAEAKRDDFEFLTFRHNWLQPEPQGRFGVSTNTESVVSLDEQFSLLGTLSSGNNRFSSVAFDQSGSIIFAGLSASNDNDRYIEQFYYPSFLRGPQIEIEGYVNDMVRAGDRILILTTDEGPNFRSEYYQLSSFPIQ